MPVRFRRSPFLVGYWKDARLLVHNYASGRAAAIGPDVWRTLDACAEWQTVQQLSGRLGVDPQRLRRLVRALTACSLLQRSDRPPDPRDAAMSALETWNPAAGFFHAATKQVRFLAPAAATAMANRRARERRMPPPTKRIRGAATVPLPSPDYAGAFPQVVLARRTWRRFGRAPISLEDVATTLALAVGVQHWVPTRFGRLPLKTSPSGGARHPIEAYLCARRVRGLRPGLYHYASDAHRLERIRGGDMTARLKAWMPRSRYFAQAAFVVVLTAVLERQVWRYPYARAYRAALAEAGHVCQTFCLAATWRGLAPFCLMGLNDPLIEQDLGIDGVSETVLYVAGAGTRPRGATWAPRVRGTLERRRNPAFG
ncbi:MAG TPA: SagB family peptide dehydrogenase [Vicinamibacterales bacterium]|nr:SagB family peptide dehydrogenase [Vicinamibacterales bacterium]